MTKAKVIVLDFWGKDTGLNDKENVNVHSRWQDDIEIIQKTFTETFGVGKDRIEHIECEGIFNYFDYSYYN